MFNKIVGKLNINSSRKYLDNFAHTAASSVPQNGLVLDAGAGSCPYKHHFSHAKYESADFCKLDGQYAEITYICDLASLPVDNNRYDLIFCSQTLEHVPNPQQVLQEFHRVLKPGCQLWLSAPLFYEEHQVPYDFYRYTQYGFKYLLESTGFTVSKIEWLEGYYGTLSYQLKMAALSLPKNPKHYGGGLIGIASASTIMLLKPLLAMLSIFFARLDIHYKCVSAGQCKNYTIVAIK